MKRAHRISGHAAAAIGAFVLMATALACDEDGKTVPERCADPPLPLEDIQKTPPPKDDNRRFNDGGAGSMIPPCITEVGHAVSSFDDGSGGDTATAGTSAVAGSGGSPGSGGSDDSGTSGQGSGGDAGTAGSANAGAGGA
ncbi:MAG: hypothetical protein K0R38_3568 [Polyangiaceae bacterium]|jgi:hypothetical protein|nr:hypothetical protein [Polyangiaceae bacterium]